MPKVEDGRCFFTQQLFLVGTYNEDGSANFAPISWVSYTWGSPACLVLSMFGNKRTKDNIARDGFLTATIVTPDMLALVEDLGGPPVADKGAAVTARGYAIEKARTVAAPLIAGSKFSYECQVRETLQIGDTHTYFAEIKEVNVSEEILKLDFFDLREINPVVYSPGHYFTIGEHLGKIGDFHKRG